MILTDIDGLYDKDPHKDEDARIIPVVEEITEHLFEIAGGKGSKFGTGGMITKLQAAQIATVSWNSYNCYEMVEILIISIECWRDNQGRNIFYC